MTPLVRLLSTVFMRCASASLRLDDPTMERWRRVIICVSPRGGKSEVVSIHGPAWYEGHNPDHVTGVISYEATFAEGFGAAARNILSSFGPRVFGTSVDPRSEAKDWWGTIDHGTGYVRRGGMRAIGIGGPIMGKGFNLLVIDDPIKNAQEALSPTVRQTHKDFWQAVAKSRLEPGAAVLVVMQRWHEDDLAGYLMREEGTIYTGGRWNPIIVPLDAEPITRLHIPGLEGELPDPLGRQPGQRLATRYSDSEIDDMKQTTPTFWWNAQRQQRPQAPQGAVFKRESTRTYEVLPDYFKLGKTGPAWLVPRRSCRLFTTTDLAASTKNSADYFSLGVWAVTPQRDLILLHVIRDRYEGPDQDAVFETVWRTWRPLGLAFMGVEQTAFQLTMVQRLKRKGMVVHPLKADSDKFSRAVTAGVMWDAEQIFVPAAPLPWKQPFLDEIYNFPYGAHDDQVDMLSYAALVPLAGSGANIRLLG